MTFASAGAVPGMSRSSSASVESRYHPLLVL
jgi:hypothetical protein